jgi:hypothetical protein
VAGRSTITSRLGRSCTNSIQGRCRGASHPERCRRAKPGLADGWAAPDDSGIRVHPAGAGHTPGPQCLGMRTCHSEWCRRANLGRTRTVGSTRRICDPRSSGRRWSHTPDGNAVVGEHVILSGAAARTWVGREQWAAPEESVIRAHPADAGRTPRTAVRHRHHRFFGRAGRWRSGGFGDAPSE